MAGYTIRTKFKEIGDKRRLVQVLQRAAAHHEAQGPEDEAGRGQAQRGGREIGGLGHLLTLSIKPQQVSE